MENKSKEWLYDEIIRLSNQLKQNGNERYIINVDPAMNFYFETKDQRTNREYKEGKLTKDEAFLELL